MIGITTHELAVLGIGMGIAGGLGAAWGVLAWWMRLMAAVAIPTAPFVAIPLFCFAVFVWLLLDAVIFTTGPSTTHPLGQAAAGTFLLSFGIVCYGTLPAVLGGAVSMWACHAIARRRRSTPH